MKKFRIISALLFLLSLAMSLVFAYFAFSSQLIPTRLAFIAITILVIFFLLIAFLIFKTGKKSLVIVGGVLSILLIVALLFSTLYINRAVTAAKNISTPKKVEVASVCVYMLADETDESTELTIDMKYGILEFLDRENTDLAVKMLEEDLKGSLTLQEYSGPTALLDALLNHEVDAIIMNNAFLDLISDTESHGKTSSMLREVKKTHVEKEVPAATEVSKPKKQTGTTDKPSTNTTSEKEPDKILTVYFSGIDNRGGLIDLSRSDVNVIAVANFTTHQVLLVTTPRDFYVPLSISHGIKDKLTHAGIYGVQVSIDTLDMLYDIDIDYYFRVNFEGFINIIEAMGGVTVYVDKEFSTTEYTFPEGPNEINGYKALSFVRNRFGIGDQQRGRNQMALIKGVIDKATSTDMLLHFSDILSSVEGSFETNMPYDVLSSIVRDQLDTGADWNVVSYAVTGTGASRVPYSLDQEVFVFIPDETTVQTAKDLMAQVYAGKVPELPEPPES